tara:strand:- start:271 stop:444 length:174 start_codon:yes stop_codon:yes gene_type:complete
LWEIQVRFQLFQQLHLLVEVVEQLMVLRAFTLIQVDQVVEDMVQVHSVQVEREMIHQ